MGFFDCSSSFLCRSKCGCSRFEADVPSNVVPNRQFIFIPLISQIIVCNEIEGWSESVWHWCLILWQYPAEFQLNRKIFFPKLISPIGSPAFCAHFIPHVTQILCNRSSSKLSLFAMLFYPLWALEFIFDLKIGLISWSFCVPRVVASFSWSVHAFIKPWVTFYCRFRFLLVHLQIPMFRASFRPTLHIQIWLSVSCLYSPILLLSSGSEVIHPSEACCPSIFAVFHVSSVQTHLQFSRSMIYSCQVPTF